MCPCLKPVVQTDFICILQGVENLTKEEKIRYNEVDFLVVCDGDACCLFLCKD